MVLVGVVWDWGGLALALCKLQLWVTQSFGLGVLTAGCDSRPAVGSCGQSTEGESKGQQQECGGLCVVLCTACDLLGGAVAGAGTADRSTPGGFCFDPGTGTCRERCSAAVTLQHCCVVPAAVLTAWAP